MEERQTPDPLATPGRTPTTPPGASLGLGSPAAPSPAAAAPTEQGLVSQLEGIAAALQSASDTLQRTRLITLQDAASELARQLHTVAGTLREGDLEALLEELRGFARRRPELFLGSALVAGVVVGHLLRSARP